MWCDGNEINPLSQLKCIIFFFYVFLKLLFKHINLSLPIIYHWNVGCDKFSCVDVKHYLLVCLHLNFKNRIEIR